VAKVPARLERLEDLEDEDGILRPGARTNGLGVNSLVGLVRAIETDMDVSQSMRLRKVWPLAGSP
jgi:hypothetical protein